jgi:hypothetical protein
MKKKWTPHIIAVGAFVVFIVLGLACAAAPAPLEPEDADIPIPYSEHIETPGLSHTEPAIQR